MPRLPPSLTTPDRRYSVPPKPDFASQMLLGSSFDHFCSAEQQAWSLTIQSILRSSTACHSASTSSRGRIGGFAIGIEQLMPDCHFAAERNVRKNLLHGPSRIHRLARTQVQQIDIQAVG